MSPIHYASSSRFELVTSFILVYGLALLVPAVAASLAWARYRRMARRARWAHDDFARTAPLAAGHATLVGVVETSDAAPAVELTLEQVGKAYSSKNGSGIRWTESRRNLDVRPFHLTLDSGERVRVHADATLGFSDDLGAPRLRSSIRRTRKATLENGDRVYLVGRLAFERDDAAASGGYRGGGKSWVLAGTSRERLLISTKPFDALFRAKARFSAITAALVVVLVGLGNLALADFHRLNVGGEVVEASDLRPTTYQTQGKNGTVTHYRIEGTLPDGLSVADDTNRDVYARVLGQKGATVPFVIVPGSLPRVAQIGTEPGIPNFAGVFVVLIIGASAFVYWLARKRSTPWWERKLVIDLEPTGSS